MANEDLISQIFQKYLGRSPSEYEARGFAGAMSNGILDPIGLSMFIQSTAEFQQKNIPSVAQQYYQQMQPLLADSNKQTLKQAWDVAQSNLASKGRPDSSALTGQFSQAAQNLAGQNAQMMAQGVGNYLGGAYGQQTQQQQGYGNLYGQGLQGQQNYQNQSKLLQQQNQYYQQYQDQAMKQAKENQWFQLGGSLLGGAGQVVGGGLAGGYF